MAGIKEVVQFWVDLGLLDVILPFVVSFIIVFALLERMKLFGPGRRNIHAMLAFVMGFLVVAAVDTVKVLTSVLQYGVLALIIIFFLFLVGGMVGVKNFHKAKALIWASAAIVVALALGVLSSFGLLDNILEPGYAIAGIAVLIFIGVVTFIVGRTETEPEEKKKKTTAPSAAEISSAPAPRTSRPPRGPRGPRPPRQAPEQQRPQVRQISQEEFDELAPDEQAEIIKNTKRIRRALQEQGASARELDSLFGELDQETRERLE